MADPEKAELSNLPAGEVDDEMVEGEDVAGEDEDVGLVMVSH